MKNQIAQTEPNEKDVPFLVVEDINMNLMEALFPDGKLNNNHDELLSIMTLEYISTGFYECIKFLDVVVWDTDEYAIPYGQDDEPISNLYDFVLTQMRQSLVAMVPLYNILGLKFKDLGISEEVSPNVAGTKDVQ